jgi:hypothetical protein
MIKKDEFINNKINFFMLLLLEVALLSFIFFFQFIPMVGGLIGGNATVITYLQVGNVFPEVLNISINNGVNIVLTANDTKTVVCSALIRDWNNESDFSNVYAEFFNSSWGSANDNNNHYTNSSCNITLNFGSWHGISDDNYTAVANCTFNVWYYANPGNWNCTVVVNDTYNWNATGTGNINVSELLAVGLPDSINYGTVNATYVSNEKIANVTNFGNVAIDVALSGYAVSVGDGRAMNCTLGSVRNISINYEKYNLSRSTSGVLSLTEFELSYINLTSPPLTKEYNLNYRQDDAINEAINFTYWRIYVPLGVAGTCQGNIVFGAIKSI